ncbi:MAG: restriction endonuclease subunit S [Pedobacter sp.]|nr:MAG: restriction endonuclease subunit S [Pedobacter sp.]
MRIKIGDACEFINGGSWTESDYRDNGLPVLKVSNFNTSGFTINDISYLNYELGNKYEKNKLELNDIIIATVGSHPSLVNSAAGRTIRVNSNVVNYYLNQNAICLRVKEYEIIDQIYLYYLTETTAFRNFIQQRGKGAANQMRIPISGIKDFSWDFPPLETQNKIASILSGYDDLIENNLKRIKILEEMAQQTYEEWFVRMRFPGHQSATINSATGLPEGWDKVKLGDFINFKKGKKLEETFEEKLPETEKVLLLDSLESGKFNYTKIGNHSLVKRGDILMLMDGARSSYVFLADNGVIGSTMAKVETKNLPSSLLFYYFQKNLEWLQINNTGAAIPHANPNFIKKIDFKMPNKELLDNWELFIQPIWKNLWNLKDQNQRLREARDILLPRLMMGMVEV